MISPPLPPLSPLMGSSSLLIFAAGGGGFVGGEKKDSEVTQIHRLELNMNSAFNPPLESNTCSVPQPWGGKCVGYTT
jgi:hypothetical protein